MRVHLRKVVTLCACALLAACRPSPAPPDAGVTPPPSRPSPSPTPPGPPPLTLAPASGCRPYWTLVELGCDPARIAAQFPKGTTFCDPAHERLSRTALLRFDPKATELKLRELVAGAQWNDDPEGLLARDPSGLAWCRAFVAAQKQARTGAVSTLLGRSQFGDLQFVHGLAVNPGETNLESYQGMALWAELTYRVGTGEIAPTTRLRDVPILGFAALLPRDGRKTIAALFGTPPGGDVSARALGSLLHLLQDFAGNGHAAPADKETLERPVKAYQFTTVRGEHPLHRLDTGWRALWADDATIAAWRPTIYVVQQSVDVLRLAAQRQPWSAAKQYLDTVTFTYSTLDTPLSEASPAVE
jgi:hypothetical protein